jgi:hypothetical protein
MRFQRLAPFAYVFGICLCFFWGCQGNKPLSPSRNVSLSIFIPPSNQLKASLLGVAQNEVTYRVDGPGHVALAESSVGPFSTAANYGSVDFTVDIPQADNLVLSVQLDDAASHQPLALGAVGLNLLSSPVSDVVVEMGSVTRTCYAADASNASYSFDFSFDTYTVGGTDIALNSCNCDSNAFYFQYYQPAGIPASFPVSDIAYLGKGDMVDHDYVPPASAFFADSLTAKGSAAVTAFEAGDIYCLAIPGTPLRHIWVQITDPGGISNGPSFIFRQNSLVPYFSYQQTTADLAGTCTSITQQTD